MNFISSYLREFFWQCKQHLSYSPKLTKKQGIKSLNTVLQSFNSEQQHRLEYLINNYPLDSWARLCNQTEYIENLYILDLLDQHIDKTLSNGVGLDIGCRSFSHLPALSAFYSGPWHGVELDANARYWNGFTKAAFGEWMAIQKQGCCYISGTVLELKGCYKIVVWVLPFVLHGPLEQWGLPLRYFQPIELLQKAWDLLSDDGVMIIINQGELEAKEQGRLFDLLGIKAHFIGEITSIFSPFKKLRYGWEVRK